jgi:broad specificity phosphatase PhoE
MVEHAALIDWARHGENVANVTRTLSHRVFDGDLTPVGRAQAEQLGRRLAAREGPRPGLLVCSPLRRARQTAQILADHLDLAVAAELEGLREIDVGSVDGRSDDAAWAVYDDVLDRWRRGDAAARFPGGEDLRELTARLAAALTQVAAAGGDGPALVVAHGANLRAALPLLTGAADPGRDLPTGGLARLGLTDAGDGDVAGRPPFRVLAWE